MLIPVNVLIKEMASVPAFWAARAISAISVTLGESLVIRVFE